jgi:hypothetical protein
MKFCHNHWSFLTQEANTSGDNEGAELKDHTEVIVKVGKNQLLKEFTKLVLRIGPKVLLLATVFMRQYQLVCGPLSSSETVDLLQWLLSGLIIPSHVKRDPN